MTNNRLDGTLGERGLDFIIWCKSTGSGMTREDDVKRLYVLNIELLSG